MFRSRPWAMLVVALVAVVAALEAAALVSAARGGADRALDLGAGGAAVAVLAVLVIAAMRPPTLEAQVEGTDLVIRFHGWDVLWTARRDVRVPVTALRAVAVCRPDSLWPGWWHRRIGTVVPSLIKAGWFGGADGRELWDVRAHADAVDIRLAGGLPLSRLVLQVPDPAGLVEALEAAAHAH